MLRRVVRGLRAALLTAGFALLISIPASFVVAPRLAWAGSGSWLASDVKNGVVGAVWLAGDDRTFLDVGITWAPYTFRPYWWHAIIPWVEVISVNAICDGLIVNIPLWLLAFLCLAWPVSSFIIARRKRRRGFPVEPKGDQMFIVLLDEPGLFVFPSTTDAVRFIEPIDAETEARTAFDASGIPYRVEWIRPNRRGIFMIEPGEYRFAPAGPADTPALIRLLEAHPEHAQPSEANTQLRSLLARLRAVDRHG